MPFKSEKKSLFRNILSIPPEERTNFDIHELTEVLGDIRVFEEYKMTPKIQALCRRVTLHTYLTQEFIFRQGDEADAFYIILSGRVNLTVRNSNDSTEIIAELKEDDTFGELGLIYGGSRTASAISMSTCEVIKLSKEVYDKEIKGDDILVKAKAYKHFRKHALFKCVSDSFLEEISSKAKKPIEFRTNDIILKQGVKPDGVYFITRGTVKLLKRIDFRVIKNCGTDTSFSINEPQNEDYQYQQVETRLVEVEQLGKLDFIGAHEVFHGLNSSCSVIATMPTSAYKVNPQDFRFIDSHSMQFIMNMTSPCPSDKELRKHHVQNMK